MTIGTPGCVSRKSRTSAAVIDSASEHPAFMSGISTVFSGFKSFAVSAMKWIAGEETITDALLRAASRARRQTVTDDVGDRMEDVRRLVVVREDDGVPLALQFEDRGNVLGQHRPFEFRHMAFDPGIEIGQRHPGGTGSLGLLQHGTYSYYTQFEGF